MFKKSTIFSHTNNQNGAVAVLVGLLLTALVGFSALAIDIGYLLTKRNEIQDIADAAALGACMGLGQIYDSMNYTQQQTYVISADRIAFIAGRATATADWYTLNGPGSARYAIAAADVHIGQWDWDNNILNETVNQPDSVQVKVRRDTTANGNGVVNTFLAGIFSLFGGNFNTFELTTTATAGLSGLAKVYDGELIAPIGVSLNYIDHCGSVVPSLNSPAVTDCVGWHNFFDSPYTQTDIGIKCIDLIAAHPDGIQWLTDNFGATSLTIPATAPDKTLRTEIGDDYYFFGGSVPDLFTGSRIIYTGPEYIVVTNPSDPTNGDLSSPAPFIALFDFYRFRDDDGGGKDDIWTATLPVYDDGVTCTNPTNGATEIVGFAKMQIYMEPGTTTAKLKLICHKQMLKEPVYVDAKRDFARGGGLIYNAKGFVPNLIQ